MKTLKTISLLIGLFAALAGHAQTFNGNYVSVTNNHYKEGVKTTSSTKFKPGSISVTQEQIKVDTASYVIVKHSPIEEVDEGQFIQPLIIITTTKKGTYKALDCVLLLKHDKSIAEVIFHKSKSSIVSYLIN